VCPAMNQGTFKYTKLSARQEERSLKLIHHNFRWDERLYYSTSSTCGGQANRLAEVDGKVIQVGLSDTLCWRCFQPERSGAHEPKANNPPYGASLSRGWY